MPPKESNNDIENKDKKIKKDQKFFLLLIVLIIVAFIGFCCGTNIYFTVMYETTYYPESSIEIEKIVDNVSLINDSYQKLDAIGQWVTYDFIDYVHINIFEDAKIDYYNLFGYTCYKCDRVRAPPYKYHGDPYWIAYHRFGGCGELAHLYCYVANLSGFETRVVLADYSEGNNHAWVELELNDELMYVDPTLYWCNVHNNTTAKEWIMPAIDWNVWDAGLDSIVYEDTKEDVSDHYPLANMTKKMTKK